MFIDRPDTVSMTTVSSQESTESHCNGRRLMANVRFTVTRDMPFGAGVVFAELIDWPGHAKWVPLTRVEVLSGDGGPGTVFVATSGIGRIVLPDRMRVEQIDPVAMTVSITKVGPLTGNVQLSVTATSETTSRLDWVEDIRVPRVPQFLSKIVGAAARSGFQTSITRLTRILAENKSNASSNVR